MLEVGIKKDCCVLQMVGVTAIWCSGFDDPKEYLTVGRRFDQLLGAGPNLPWVVRLPAC